MPSTKWGLLSGCRATSTSPSRSLLHERNNENINMDGEGGLEEHFAADTTLLVRCVFSHRRDAYARFMLRNDILRIARAIGLRRSVPRRSGRGNVNQSSKSRRSAGQTRFRYG